MGEDRASVSRASELQRMTLMVKIHAVLLVSVAALAACVQNQPAASEPTTAITANQNTTGGNAGSTERMPPDSPGSSTMTAPSAATRETGLPKEAPIAGGAPNATPTSPTPLPSWTDGQILDVIHQANGGEIDQAKLASTRARDGRVKRLAAMMLNDHSAADGEVQSLVERLATSLEPTPESRRIARSTHDATQALGLQAGGADFDRAYLEAQVEEQQAVLATIDSDLMPRAQSPDVRNLLTEVRGKVMLHLQRAQELGMAMHK
jgi:putative membrane protein